MNYHFVVIVIITQHEYRYRYLQGPFEGRSIANSSMIGTGLTMEGIFQNYVMYDLMLEMAWRTSSPDPVQWWVLQSSVLHMCRGVEN